MLNHPMFVEDAGAGVQVETAGAKAGKSSLNRIGTAGNVLGFRYHVNRLAVGRVRPSQQAELLAIHNADIVKAGTVIAVGWIEDGVAWNKHRVCPFGQENN